MHEAGVTNATILTEPTGRNTAPAIACAALTLIRSTPDAMLLVMPADHAIRDVPAFHAALAEGIIPALCGKIVTFGMTPDRTEIGYGYIQCGAALNESNAFAVARFVEKPDAKTAAHYVASGNYLWNSGIFLFRASALLEEMARLQPALLAYCRQAVAEARSDGMFLHLGKAFEAAPAISIDHAVMEHTARAAVVPAAFGWSDIGSWSALWDIASKDSSGNAAEGPVMLERVTNSYLRSEGPLVAAIGLDNIAVIATPDAVLVCDRAATQDVKMLVERLEHEGSSLHRDHRRVERPWGSYESIDRGALFQVKHIMVKPGARLSLQMHHRRAEHWTVVSGTGKVTRGDETFALNANETTFIPQGTKHRLENPGSEPLHLIEVQYGDYLGEDDIVRFEDNYGRI